jgi:hypothetical protein
MADYIRIMRSTFASPGDEYLVRIGELVYRISSLEGQLIWDIPRLSRALPDSFGTGELLTSTTRGIGQRLLDVAPKATDERVRDYLKFGGFALRTAGELRNHILHARPATDEDNNQRLHRNTGSKWFWIDDEYLDFALDQIADLVTQVNQERPSFDDWPAT